MMFEIRKMEASALSIDVEEFSSMSMEKHRGNNSKGSSDLTECTERTELTVESDIMGGESMRSVRVQRRDSIGESIRSIKSLKSVRSTADSIGDSIRSVLSPRRFVHHHQEN